MRWLLSLTSLLLSCVNLSAGTVVYVSLAGEKKIAVYRVESSDGKLTHAADVKVEGEPGALTTDPKRRFLFASLRAEGKLASFRIDPSGGLTPLSVVTAGADPAPGAFQHHFADPRLSDETRQRQVATNKLQ